MNKLGKFAMVAVAVALVGSASAEVDAGITSLISGCQGTITGIITAVLTAGGVILLAALGLRALPYAYRKITGFFK